MTLDDTDLAAFGGEAMGLEKGIRELAAKHPEREPWPAGQGLKDAGRALDEARDHVVRGDAESAWQALTQAHASLGGATVLQMRIEQQNRSKATAASAKQKGSVWRAAAVAQWNEKGGEFRGLVEFCERIEKKELHGPLGVQRAPAYKRVYEAMLAARRAGEAKTF